MKIKLLIALNHILFGIGLYLYFDLWWLSLLGVIIIGKIGGEIGLHKYISHNSFKLNSYLKQIIYFLGALNGFGSHISWAGVHRKHHAFADEPGDPHGYQAGWRVWTTFWKPFNIEIKYVKDLIKDNTLRWYHENYFKFIFAVYVIIGLISLPVLLLFICGGSTLSFHQAGIVNTLGHKNGLPINSKIVNIFSFGSGYHKNHHLRPTEMINGKYDIFGRLANDIRTK